jgi:hypothetical protein
MSLPINAVGQPGAWVKDNSANLAKQGHQPVAADRNDAGGAAQGLRRYQVATEVVARKGVPQRSVRETDEREVRRRPERSDRERPEPGLSGIAQQLGMTVSQLIHELDQDGVTIRSLFAERGIAPAPGSLADLAL